MAFVEIAAKIEANNSKKNYPVIMVGGRPIGLKPDLFGNEMVLLNFPN